jgi:alkylation response protein AidB-like acyl-CoA dehydrogenase
MAGTIAEDLGALQRFVDDEMAPHAATWDETEQMPRAHVRRLADAGLLAQTVAPDAGGAGRATLDVARTIAEVARGCGVSARVVVDSNFGAVQMIDRFASDELRRRILPRVRTGECLVSIVITEPEAGSAANELTTRAVVEGDTVVLDGTKRWITGAGEREFSVVFARFDDTPGSRGIGAVVVESGTPGFRVGEREPTMGLRGLREGELHFENCRVPAANLIFGAGGFGRLMSAYNGQRVGAASVALGLGRGALEAATRYARERRQFGRPIGDFQAIQLMLADMAIQLDAAELLIERSARSSDRHGFPERYESSVAKTFASEAAVFATNKAIEVLGGNGYSRRWPVERMARDARMFTIAGGTVQLQRLAIAQKLLGER